MPPITAATATPATSAADFSAFPGMAAEGFADALMAFLSPESLPAITLEDAMAIVDGRLQRAGLTNPFDSSKPAIARAEDEAGSELDPLLAMAAFPIPMPIAPPPALAEAMDVGARPQAAFDALAAAMPRAVAAATEGMVRAEPADEEAWSFEMLEAHFAAQGAPHAAAAAAPAPTTPPVSMQIDAPLGSSGFREQSADALRWMVRQGETRAEIALKPADLGPIQIELRMVADRVEVAFVASHPDTRDALQDQLPQLREMLAESGIHLGEASVRDEKPSDTPFMPAFQNRSGEREADAGTAPLPRMTGGTGLVDTFA